MFFSDNLVLFHCLISNLKSIYVFIGTFLWYTNIRLIHGRYFSIYERFVFHSLAFTSVEPASVKNENITKKWLRWNYISHSKNYRCVMFLHALQQLHNAHTLRVVQKKNTDNNYRLSIILYKKWTTLRLLLLWVARFVCVDLCIFNLWNFDRVIAHLIYSMQSCERVWQERARTCSCACVCVAKRILTKCNMLNTKNAIIIKAGIL